MTQAEAVARRREKSPVCSRCGSTDRLRFFADWSSAFGAWSGRALCYRCDDLGLTAGSRPRSTHSSLRAFYLWLLAAFIAGAIAGAALTALLSTSSRGDNSGRTSEFEGSAVRAGRMVEARAEYARLSGHEAERSSAVHTGPAPSSTDPARATAIDELPASDTTAHHAGRSGSAGRDDPAAVLAAIDAAAEEFGHEPELMRIVAFCESSWDPQAIGDGGAAVGLFQFHEPTARRNGALLGYPVTLEVVFSADGDLLRADESPRMVWVDDWRRDPVASSRVAAEMWTRDQHWQWTCSR